MAAGPWLQLTHVASVRFMSLLLTEDPPAEQRYHHGGSCLPVVLAAVGLGVSCSPCRGDSGLNLGDGTLGFLSPSLWF